MSCSERERLFLADASAEQIAAHQAACVPCARLAADLDRVEATLSDLRPAAVSPALREALLSIPARTVSCEGADELAAAALEGPLPPADLARLEFHCSRCEACAEASKTLAGLRELARPEPAPWLNGRIVANRPRRRERRGWRVVASPKVVIALAYAAAVVVMLAGFNPADLARKAGVGRIEETAKASFQVAGNSLADRLGAVEENAMRTLAKWKGHVTGYGRAAISTAMALVMKSEPQRPPNRPRSGEDKGVLQKNENEIETQTWRA
jgi:hypothetical protein